jgi:hypothetical protein
VLPKECVEAEPPPQLETQIATAELPRSFQPHLLHQNARHIGSFLHDGVGREQLQLRAFAVLVEDLHRPQPLRLRRRIQFAEITERALPRPVRRARGFHQRPVRMFLAVFAPAIGP